MFRNINKKLAAVGFVAFTTCVAQSASAIIVNVTFDRSVRLSDAGAIAEVTNTVGASNGATAALGYTVSDLTIDGNGTMDDSINFEFLLSATGSTASGVPARGIGFSSGAMGVNTDDSPASDNASLFDLDGESLALSLTSATVSLGAGATTPGQIDFIGFTGFGLNAFFGSDSYILSGGTSADGSALTTSPAVFDPHPNFTLAYDASTGGNGFRIHEIQARFEITAIPEPSSALFAGVLGLGIITQRRRR